MAAKLDPNTDNITQYQVCSLIRIYYNCPERADDKKNF